MEKAQRLIDAGVSDEDKEEIERLMERTRIALTDRNWQQVTEACNELTDVLFYLED